MKTFRFIFFFLLTTALGIALNTKIDSIPPLGKFLSPFHGFWQNAENTPIDLTPVIRSNGISEDVNIYFDEVMIPHIFAQNDLDLSYSLGYVTAYQRLWQLEFQLLAAEGRISEIIGDVALDFDRGQRRIGLKFGAQNSEKLYKETEPALYEALVSYSQGINDYISSLSYKDYPIEYKLLDYSPEEWTPFKSVLFLQNMHNELSRGNRDLEHTNAIKLWGKEFFEILYPERPNFSDPIIPNNTPFNFISEDITTPQDSFPTFFTNPSIKEPHPDNGSNNFVVNGNKTKSGNVILANETDLRLTHPSIWYMAHLNTPDLNVMGHTFTGTPGIIIGFNDSIAWAATNAKRDLVDWFYIQFEDEKRDSYLYNNNWVPTKKVVEEFKIRGEKSFYDTIIFTHHGPVTYDKSFPSSRSELINLAMRWTAHDGSKEYKAFYLGNRANNEKEFRKAFDRYYDGPPQNWILGSAQGDISINVHGKFPLKWREQGKFIMDGNNPNHEWSDFIPKEHVLRSINPQQNFLSSANQHPADSTYPYYVYDYTYEHYRGRRLNDRLRLMSNITTDDMKELQHDNFNYNASEMLPMLLDSLDTTTFTTIEREYFDILQKWDYFNEPELKAPSVYEAWWKKLNEMLWEEIDSAEVKLYRPNWYNTYYILKTKPDFKFIDNQYTSEIENAGSLFRLTYKEAIKELTSYLEDESNSLMWYRYKGTIIQHLLRLDPFSDKDVKVGGNKSIVNAVSKYHGPSQRMVVELSKDKIDAWSVYPGSQSGNPGNPKYGDMIDMWATGKYHKLLFKNELTEDDGEIIYHVKIEVQK